MDKAYVAGTVGVTACTSILLTSIYFKMQASADTPKGSEINKKKLLEEEKLKAFINQKKEELDNLLE
jgi:hypothetical protein